MPALAIWLDCSVSPPWLRLPRPAVVGRRGLRWSSLMPATTTTSVMASMTGYYRIIIACLSRIGFSCFKKTFGFAWCLCLVVPGMGVWLSKLAVSVFLGRT